MGFVGGCMIWMVMVEVMLDSFKDVGKLEVVIVVIFVVIFMEVFSVLLDNNSEGV